ncbi:tRNA-specific 2-thiouridylase MnmA [Candidatus Nasuia deltocephalinicola]|uniref:tRNA-specific 2-thiouridylase MnmA n=1 Tax=Candidatus Nasuia deltocephalincola TaxID=1160784 RepID=A0A0S2UPM6_9PROT|nr:tRNA-specific 2-thiouridylase MnmA [Candidatus Nasuia deltocephalinicola]
MKKIIIVFLSGGIDSLFSILILKILKYKLYGFYMLNWIILKKEKIINIITNISKILNIKIIIFNFKKIYFKKIFLKFLKNYNKGYFINIDSFCNKIIKFNILIKIIKKLKNVCKVCTGHYSKLKNIKKIKVIKNSNDKNKNQLYFLNFLNKKKLKSIIFVLGKIKKNSIIEIFLKNFKYIFKIKSSKGICFFENLNINYFLQNYLYKNIKFNKFFKKLYLKKNLNILKNKIVIIKISINLKLKKNYYYMNYKINHCKYFFTCFIRKIIKNVYFVNFYKNIKKIMKGQEIVLFYKNQCIKGIKIK